MCRKRFAEEFKIEAVRQIKERGFAVMDVAERLGIPAEKRAQKQDQGAEIRLLQDQLKRVTEERYPKKAEASFAKESGHGSLRQVQSILEL